MIRLVTFHMPTCTTNPHKATLDRKGKILDILTQEEWQCALSKLRTAISQRFGADSTSVEAALAQSGTSMPEGFFDPIYVCLEDERDVKILQSRLKAGYLNIALANIDEGLTIARVCPAAEVGDMLYLVQGSCAALIVREHFSHRLSLGSGVLIGMAALPVRGKIDAWSEALDHVIFQQGITYRNPFSLLTRRRMASEVIEDDDTDWGLTFRRQDVLSNAEVDILRGWGEHSTTRKRSHSQLSHYGEQIPYRRNSDSWQTTYESIDSRWNEDTETLRYRVG
jgi:hypothetical protein